MKKNKKFTILHIVTGICILAAGTLIGFIVSNGFGDFSFDTIAGQGTKIEFASDSAWENGFHREATVYTEGGITSVAFSGKVTIDGSATLAIVSNNDGSVVYNKTYTNTKAEIIEITVDDLIPYTYYTLIFSSDNAQKGHLILTTDQKLAESPERPSRQPK